MNATAFFGFGSHSELVQLATDLLSEMPEAELWIPRYDAALESEDDMTLVQFCWAIWTKGQQKSERTLMNTGTALMVHAPGHEPANEAIEATRDRVQHSSQRAA